MKERAMPFLILLCLIVPAALSAGLIEENIDTLESHGNVASAAYTQEYTWIVVDIKRVRMMTVGDEPTFYLKVYVNGENAIYWPQNYTGNDVWFEWPRAWGNVTYDPSERIPIQIQIWENKKMFDEPLDISK